MIQRMHPAKGVIMTTLLLVFGLTISCISNAPAREMNGRPLDWEPGNPGFRSYYGWEEKAGTWKMERIPNPSGGSIAIHTFQPPLFNWKKGTVFILHGYLEHTALRAQLALEFVKRGWIVVGIDLPGHGLSTGKRAEIDDFSEYLAAFEATMAAHTWPKPWRAVGHSTGGATILMALQNPALAFNLVVLEAPLVRTYMWTPFLWLKSITEAWTSTVTRRTGTSNQEDPFYLHDVPLDWFDAAELYYLSTKNWTPVQGQFLIVQGADDTVVDARYNIPFLETVLSDVVVIEIVGGKHQLLLDDSQAGEAARQELFARW